MVNKIAEDFANASELLRCRLLEDIISHTEGHYDDIGSHYKEVEQLLTTYQGQKAVNLAITMRFWDGWIDARNHEWQYYTGIEMQDWPILAKSILKDLEYDQNISDPKVLKRFGPSGPGKLRTWLRYLSMKVTGS